LGILYSIRNPVNTISNAPGGGGISIENFCRSNGQNATPPPTNVMRQPQQFVISQKVSPCALPEMVFNSCHYVQILK
jgi:hypothetical protein